MKRVFLYSGIVVTLGTAALFFFYAERTFNVGDIAGPLNDLFIRERASAPTTNGFFTGLPCEHATTRPIGIMLAGDPEARPLSGIGQADMVIEAPVSVDGITRYLAFYQCSRPQEIGSVRSARSFFVGLAKGYGSILAHWGGEKDTLQDLRNGVIDNLDALPNPSNAFWRKEGVPMPHDGFTNFAQLLDAAQDLEYNLQKRTSNLFTFKPLHSLNSEGDHIITLNYPGAFQVSYHYRPDTNSYFRFKGGRGEIDALTGEQIEVKNILIIKTDINPSYSQYNDVALDGKEGKLLAFVSGSSLEGKWVKKGFEEPLLFFTQEGSPLAFEPGVTWIQIIERNQTVEVIPLRNIESRE